MSFSSEAANEDFPSNAPLDFFELRLLREAVAYAEAPYGAVGGTIGELSPELAVMGRMMLSDLEVYASSRSREEVLTYLASVAAMVSAEESGRQAFRKRFGAGIRNPEAFAQAYHFVREVEHLVDNARPPSIRRRLRRFVSWEGAAILFLAVCVVGAVVKQTHGLYGLLPRWTYDWDLERELGFVVCVVILISSLFGVALGVREIFNPRNDGDAPGLAGTAFYSALSAFMAYVLYSNLV